MQRRSFIAMLPCAAVLCASCAHTGAVSSVGLGKLLESVVKIDVWEVSQKDGGSRTFRSVGSGVLMSDDGLILTNAHVVNSYVNKIVVTLPNLERVKAEFVGWDHWTDLALIRLDKRELESKKLRFAVASLGDSDSLKTGEVVYAAGTPHGFARTLTRGIVSNTNRFFEGTILNSGYETGTFNTWIQTDAAINPGNSGGPLARPNGEVVGINTRAYTNSNNLGFAVPSNVAKHVMAEILARGKVERGYVGVVLAPLQDMESFFDIDINRGVLVSSVDALSPAAVAGILPGDIVLKIDGDDIDGRFPEQLPAIMSKIAAKKVGDKAEFLVMRGGRKFSKSLAVEPLESRVGREYTLEKWGAGMREITKAYARESKLETDSHLMVAGVRDGFPFSIAGIAAGDIIVSINRKKITTREQIEAEYEASCKSPKKILVQVLRNGSLLFFVCDLTK